MLRINEEYFEINSLSGGASWTSVSDLESVKAEARERAINWLKRFEETTKAVVTVSDLGNHKVLYRETLTQKDTEYYQESLF